MSRKSLAMMSMILVTLVVGHSTLAQAQGKKPERKNVQLKGSIEDMARGGIAKIIDGNQAEWFVKLDQKTAFTFSATAEPEWLRRGMWVRFTTKYNSKGEPQEMLKEVVVFVPKKGDKLGIYGEDKSPITNPFTKSLSNVPEGEKLLTFTVAAQVKTLKASELAVAYQRFAIAVPIGERTKILVEVPDPSLIRKGDEVSIRGWQVPGSENAVVATTVAVTAKEPLGLPNKKKPSSKDADDSKKSKEKSKEKSKD